MVSARLPVLLAAGSLVMIGVTAPAFADTPRPVPAQAPATPADVAAGPAARPAPDRPTDLDPRLVRRCLEASRSGHAPAECRRVLDRLAQPRTGLPGARPGTAVRATPRFTG